MHTSELPLVTIVAEAVLRERLIEEIRRAGATGYTIVPAEGDGSRHIRAGDRADENVRIETITSPQVADLLLSRLAQDYFPHFAIIVFVTQVQVVRGDKYV
jgi:nitrogen regulatory protein P-II 2